MIRSLARVFVLLAMIALLLVANGSADDGSKLDGPVIPQAKGEKCVADTGLMRREHMDLMTHQRDDTVVRGIRGNPYSIVGCVDCHAQTDTEGGAIRVDAEGQFCQSCHDYAAVKIDCFGCHAAVPTPNENVHHRAGTKTSDRLPWSELALSSENPSLKLPNREHGKNGSAARQP